MLGIAEAKKSSELAIVSEVKDTQCEIHASTQSKIMTNAWKQKQMLKCSSNRKVPKVLKLSFVPGVPLLFPQVPFFLSSSLLLCTGVKQQHQVNFFQIEQILNEAKSTLDTCTQIRMQTLCCCLRAVWTLTFMHTFALRCVVRPVWMRP